MVEGLVRVKIGWWMLDGGWISACEEWMVRIGWWRLCGGG